MRQPIPKPKPKKKPARQPGSTLRYPSKRMKQGPGPARTSRLPRENRRRKKKRQEAGLVYGPFYDWARLNGRCSLAADLRHVCVGRLAAHHIHHAGNGGQDERNLFDVCEGGHTLSPLSVHQLGPDSFEAYWKVRMQARADALYRAYIDDLRRKSNPL